ncbi:AAA domain-containing protein [Proteiniclasticum sp. C24MP]|uniref:AAA domain-containing protein n=1 Tax=Proteiniclasticum sp. C24MP TaxID=3374101 RepID=UPI00375450C3
MDTSQHLILCKDKDITENVRYCAYNPETKKYDVTFKNGKVYHYNFQSVEWMRNPKIIDHQWISIRYKERELFNIHRIHEFSGKSGRYWFVQYGDGSGRSFHKRHLEISVSCLNNEDTRSSLEYFRRLAAVNELRTEEGAVLLHRQYEKLDFIDRDSAMAVYLNPQRHSMRTFKVPPLIFPFGGNASQFKAVKNAMTNQFSVIQGPPGTGKTQTILNILSNILMQGKTVLVVSNNNSAIANVEEKLSSDRYDLGFLVASLGNSENKNQFIQRQSGTYPVIEGWKADEEKKGFFHRGIRKVSLELHEVFQRQERLAMTRQEMESLETEIRHFKRYCEETGITLKRKSIPHSSKKMMRIWQQCYAYEEEDKKIPFWFKLKNMRIIGISDWRLYKKKLPEVITHFQQLYYDAKESELKAEIHALSDGLKSDHDKMDHLTKLSMDYLKAELYEKFGKKRDRKVFEGEDLWKHPREIIEEYPIVLSTTFSSKSSLGKDVMFDYLIMDEASQVDVTTGALALSCAKNAVIVGDLKQLPNVISEEMKKTTDEIFSRYDLPEGYSFSENSFLKSVCRIIPDIPQTLLREHYRCHPKIIGFCNQKFYNNELIVMTQDRGESDAISLFKTVTGNHRREHFNQRQIDVLMKEALPALSKEGNEEIGVIAPYNEQVHAIRDSLGDKTEIDVATVHKFQGREKDTIILTPVDDVVTDFSDDPYLLNVAISRAKKRLCLVVSGNEQPKDSNFGDLISYIEYNNFEVVESELYSVFDYLYTQYTRERMDFLKDHRTISEYDSENLMFGVISGLLKKYDYLSLGVIAHQPLNMLIRNPKHLSDEETRYVMNRATHVDFMIYNKITKKPVFGIEVDGFHFHKEGTKQKERDLMKDRVFSLYQIPLLRFKTNGSGEKEAIERKILEYAQQ